jgi:ATP-dependent Clp protease ATP-binding subunit ClpA
MMALVNTLLSLFDLVLKEGEVMFNPNLENTLNQAFTRAREKRHEFITVEHLLLALLDNNRAAEVLNGCGANLERLRIGLGIFIDETTPHLPEQVERDIQPTLSFQRVLQRAIYQVQSLGQDEVNGTHILMAIYGEQESQAVYFLSQEHVTRSDVVNFVSKGTGQSSEDITNINIDSIESVSSPGASMSDADKRSASAFEQAASGPADEEQALIDQFCQNLNERAKNGKIDPVIGRADEIARATQVLCRRHKNNPLFVGEPGVGKTAIAEGIAQLIIEEKVPAALADATIYSLDLGILLAGTKYRGDFEKRFKAVLNALTKQKGAVVFIDEIHNLVGAGSATGGSMDASNLIKPMLTQGELRCMGATTYDEYRTFFSKDSALMRRFQKIDVEEPSNENTLAILNGLLSHFENFHHVHYTPEALSRAVELSSRYMLDRHLPDKAIDIVDEAGAFQNIMPKGKSKDVIDVEDIEQIVAKMARIPVTQITASDKSVLQNIESKLKERVFGQDHAIEVLTAAIKLSRAGLRDLNKPVGSFLFSGPTGVGKTEITKLLAEEMGLELVRFDMSEYMEKHTVSRLIGAPPGYVGYDQGGLLTDAMIKKPHCVLLLDEIEKAHPDVFNILLQVMDYGRLTDNNGRKADFRHVIIVMTTNAGAQDIEKSSIGFTNDEGEHDNTDALKVVFTPEFRNRLDAVVPFHHLDEEVIERVVDKSLIALRKQLAEKDVKLTISKEAKRWLAKRGYNKAMGARPMMSLIQEVIKQPLANAILFVDEGQAVSFVRIGLDKAKDELTINCNHRATDTFDQLVDQVKKTKKKKTKKDLASEAEE